MGDVTGDPWGVREGPATPAPEAAGEEREIPSPGRSSGPGAPARFPGSFWNPRRPHTPREAQRLSWVVLTTAAAAYWFTQWPLPDLLSSHPDLNFYVVQPVVWGALALLAGYGWRRLEERPRFSRLAMGIAFLLGVFHVAVLVIAGVVGDFGDSPIAGRLANYPKNLWYLTTLLAGAEIARAYLFRVWRERAERFAFAGATLVFFAVALPAAQWTPFDDVQEAFRVVGGRWAPGLALSALATFLVSFGGPAASFAYRFALVSFEWFTPILPDLGWLTLLLVGVVTPMASAWLMRSIYGDTSEGAARLPAPRVREVTRARPRWRRWTGWVVTAALVGLGVLFAVGAFGFHLVVIDGTSMEPAYGRGDVAIVRDAVDPALLQVNDVIVFRQGSLPVVHRIVAIEAGAGGRVFTTKGDNVDAPDPAVTEAQIEGKVVFLIPEVGHLNLLLRGR